MAAYPIDERSAGVRTFEAVFGLALGTAPGAILALVAAAFFDLESTTTLIVGLVLGAAIGGFVGWRYGDGSIFTFLMALWPP
jgi:hypothetical protein